MENNPINDHPNDTPPTDPLAEIQANLTTISNELTGMHKLYHKEFRTILDGMEKELKHYRSVNEGRVFDGILSDIAKVYAENIGLTTDIESQQAEIPHLFEDLRQILESHEVEVHKSNPEEPRNVLFTQVRQKIATDNKDLHGKIAKSHGIAIHKDNLAFVKERVDIYEYKETPTEDGGTE